MRSPRRSADEQYALVMECRSSGLSDQQWCMQHDINPGTFYNWVKRLRDKACYEIPSATGKSQLTASVKQDVVRVDIIPEPEAASSPEIVHTPIINKEAEASSVPIEIRINEAVVRITNDVDPRLLAQILRNLGGCLC